jgi:hypothetical protein
MDRSTNVWIILDLMGSSACLRKNTGFDGSKQRHYFRANCIEAKNWWR